MKIIQKYNPRYTSFALDSIDIFLDPSDENQKMLDSYKRKYISNAYSDFLHEFMEYDEGIEFEKDRDSGDYTDDDLDSMFGLCERSIDYLKKNSKTMAALGILDEYGWDIESIRG